MTRCPRMHAARAVIVALALVAALPAGGLAAPPNAVFDALLDRAMTANAAPGISIAVVQGDHVTWQAARGWADREARRPVTPATRFYIASTTKALTATAAACVAARGGLDLEASLAAALPAARFNAAVHPESIRVVDLLTHTHGIDPDGPVSVRVAYTGDYTYADLYRALASQGAASTGRAFAYSNLGYDLAGIVLDPAHRAGWKRVVEREVTRPLGMTATTAYRSKVRDRDLAMPYENTADGLERIRLAKEDANMGPAGGYFSTAGDLARLVIAELNGGRVDGRQCLPAGVAESTQRARVPQARQYDDYTRFAWGLGWDLGTYAGDTLVHRFGGFPGYGCHVSFMPAHGVGVVVLVNDSRTGMVLADAVANAVYDELLGRADAGARLDAALDSLGTRTAKLHAAIAADRARRAARSQQLSHPLAAYAGEYVNADWGTLRLSVRDGRLEARMGVARSAVEVYDAAKDRLRVELFGGGGVIDAVFTAGATRATEMRLEGASFTRP
jgi:CubicO group peptidase (beta-lactamase class C family)